LYHIGTVPSSTRPVIDLLLVFWSVHVKLSDHRWRPTPALEIDGSAPAMKERTLEGFGTRLATLRQARGLSQEELARAVDVSRRVIAYYEAQSAQPPGALLVDLARALKVSTDELLGVKPVTEKLSPKTARLLKRLRRIEELPAADQRAVLKLVDAMLDTRRRTRKAS
jgi:transcriptional regulator with XRE-family HTH domain